MTDATQPASPARLLLASVLERPVENVPADASIANFPAWDSLAHVRLILALEEDLGARLSPSTIAGLFSLADIDRLIADRRPPG